MTTIDHARTDSALMGDVAHRRVFARMGRNVGWLLGGRGFAALVSIAYLAIAARALGPPAFGTFALTLAYGSSVANFVQFESWQAVIRFGSIHLAQRSPNRLARLLGFTATLDAITALSGAVLAYMAVLSVAPLLGWAGDQPHRAGLFGAALLLSTGSTATGMLRLFDRFDWLAYTETVGPLVRLAGALIGWLMQAKLGWFLAVWAAAALAEGGSAWIAVAWLRLGSFEFGKHALLNAMSENAKLWPFMVRANLSSSLGLLGQQVGTLAVGMYGAPVDAGAFRIAGKLALALAKPIEIVSRVLYPELAQLSATDDRATLRSVVIRTSWSAALLSLLIVAITWCWGPLLLRLFSGSVFIFAQPLLVLLAIAAAIDAVGVALDPVLIAEGRSGTILGARVVGAATYLFGLVAFLPMMGVAGAAWAAIASSIVTRMMMTLSVSHMLRKR